MHRFMIGLIDVHPRLFNRNISLKTRINTSFMDRTKIPDKPVLVIGCKVILKCMVQFGNLAHLRSFNMA